jgi:hypothetical protein
MASIVFDSKSGNLVEGLVWAFPSMGDFEAVLEMNLVYGECNGRERSEDLYLCPVSKTHKTGIRTHEVEIDLFGGPAPGDFLTLTNHGFNIVSHAFAEQLKESGLTGFSLRDGVKIAENQSSLDDPKFYFLDVVGKGGFCRRWRVKGAANFCPYCKVEPVICPGCGWCSQYGCPNCGKRVDYSRREDKDGKNLLCESFPETLIVNSADWDGSDWFAVEGPGGNWFANRRAKEWFETAGLELGDGFKPALLDLPR